MRIEAIKAGKNNLVGKVYYKKKYLYIKNILKMMTMESIIQDTRVKLLL